MDYSANDMLQSVYALQTYVTNFHLLFPNTSENTWYDLPTDVRRLVIIKRVEECLDKDELIYPSTDWKNVHYHEGYGLLALPQNHLNFSSIFRTEEEDTLYGNTIFVLKVMKQLLQRESRTTKRDIYYQNVLQFTTQANLNRVVAIIASMLQVI